MVSLIEKRRKAIESAKANNSLSGFQPSPFGIATFERWISGDLTAQEAVNRIRAHHSGLADGLQSRQFEADVTTIRMAELEIDGI